MTAEHDRAETTKRIREFTQCLERIRAAGPPGGHHSGPAERTAEALMKRLAELAAEDVEIQQLLTDPYTGEEITELDERDFPRLTPTGNREREFQGLTPIINRLIRTGAEISIDEPTSITYQHTVLCQTGMPLRKMTARTWDRWNGRVRLRIVAGEALDPRTNEYVEMPLPYGSRVRLIMMHLNAEALRSGKPTIDVGRSLTSFAKRIIGYDPTGPHLQTFRRQLTALAAATVRLAMVHDGHASQINTNIITAMDLWAPNHPHQTTLWSSEVKLNHEYFESLLAHAVPLDERAVAALGHSAMGLDIYTWLAQRLHRVRRDRQEFVPWTALLEQFGGGYNRVRDFRAFFKKQLAAVHTQYPDAQFDADQKGLWLRNSPPPVTRIGVTIDGTAEVPSAGSIESAPNPE